MQTFRQGLFFVFFMLMGVFTVSAETLNWTPLEKALETAGTSGKKIYYYFYTPTCPWCKTMAEETFSAEKVITKLNADFISVKINVVETRDLARRFGLETVPTSVFLSPEGTVLLNRPGYLPPEKFLEMLEGLKEKNGKQAF
ncbi:thioredoxin family protein [Desulfobotulus sp.]|jgi:thioredoxin-related protein|uniref:thioredoxin family protein n=1 Tax=Desulfobotulus sp. TaxID=1940337 RepID=UPI002A358D79|nr:thioredoxin fold domain-containing protein [Desulfobotulus sp.]MDY0163577.1 thioredoxin fold domain-containing protein [Desulfobotulus sp.]